eukprot:m.109287 g.109287  ORF g.109287 m.109287 type:complete len:1098 (+) comp14303_c5_seq2:49-3342(+)
MSKPLLLVSSGGSVFHASLSDVHDSVNREGGGAEEAIVRAEIVPFEDQGALSFVPAKVTLGLGERTWIIDRTAFLHARVLGISPVTVEEECFETSDSGRFEDIHGRVFSDKQHVPVPSLRWRWSGEWALDRSAGHEARRRFIRRRSFTPSTATYTRVPAPFDEAVANAVSSSSGILWIITASGKVFQRIRGRMCEPEGVGWLPSPPLPRPVGCVNNVACAALAAPSRGGLWALDSSGCLHFWSTAPTSSWTSVDGLFKAVCCPGAAVWALTIDDEIVVRLGVTSECPSGRAWMPLPSPVPGRALEPFMTALSDTQLVVLDSAGQLHLRCGLAPDCDQGHAWARVVLPDDRVVRWLSGPPASLAELDERDATQLPPSPTATLHRAVLGARVAECIALLEDGADVNQRDELGRTPLHHAVLCGFAALRNLFLSNHADVNARDVNGMTPLHLAALCCDGPTSFPHPGPVPLLEPPADLMARDSHGNTPLHLAAWANNVAACTALLAHTPALGFARNNERQTPFAVADKRGNSAVMDLLARATAAALPALALPVSGQVRVVASARVVIATPPPPPPAVSVTPATPSPAPPTPTSAPAVPPSPRASTSLPAALAAASATLAFTFTAHSSSPAPTTSAAFSRSPSVPSTPTEPSTPAPAPAAPQKVFGLLERRQLLLYEAGTVDQRLGVLPLHNTMRLVPTSTSIAVLSAASWQLTLFLNNAMEMHRWVRGLLVESHAITITSLTADPTVVQAVRLRHTVASGFVGTCEYAGSPAIMRVYSPDLPPWDANLISGPPTTHVVVPRVIGRCCDLPILRTHTGAADLQYAIASPPAPDTHALLEMRGRAWVIERGHKGNETTEGLTAEDGSDDAQASEPQSAGVKCVSSRSPATFRVCVLRQLLYAAFGLASVGVDFAEVPPAGVCVDPSGRLVIHNIEAASPGRSFGDFLTQLLTRWRDEEQENESALVATEGEEPPAAAAAAKVAEADEAVDCEPSPAAAAELDADTKRDSGSPCLPSAAGATHTPSAAVSPSRALAATKEEDQLDFDALLQLVTGLTGSPGSIVDALPRLLSLLPRHVCECCSSSECLVQCPTIKTEARHVDS